MGLPADSFSQTMIHMDAHLQTEAEREGLKATISKLESDHAAKVDRLEKDKAAFAEEVIGLEVRFASTPVYICCSRGRVKTMTSLCTSQKRDMQNARPPTHKHTCTQVKLEERANTIASLETKLSEQISTTASLEVCMCACMCTCVCHILA